MRLNSGALKRRASGLLLIALGVLALSVPLAIGRWSLVILGIPLLALSVTEAYAAFKSPRCAEASAYLSSVLAMLAGNLLLLSSALVVSRWTASRRRRQAGSILTGNEPRSDWRLPLSETHARTKR
jgi:uncharacterized membrane protein HdeD (DUF308 family)